MSKLFGKWKKGLAKTRSGIMGQISSILKGKEVLGQEEIDRLEQILIEGDLGVDMSMQIIDELLERITPSANAIETVSEIIREKCLEVLEDKAAESGPTFTKTPHVVLLVGVNGTGKTTTIGKLAWYYRQKGLKVLLAGADTFRAAASEQLGIWAKRSGAETILQPHGADPAAVAYDALGAAKAREIDVLLVDTAGRLHTKTNLMEELKKISRVLKKQIADAPHEVLLVLDAITGQNGLSQAKQFTEAVGLTGIVLTKLDGTASGGIVVQVQDSLGVPVRWVGVGEGIDDLLPFNVDGFIEGLFR